MIGGRAFGQAEYDAHRPTERPVLAGTGELIETTIAHSLDEWN
jgi:hypothetical protein